jgi:hypothetical protein
MIESMLCTIIQSEFEKVVGKDQINSGKAMHIGFHMTPEKCCDQYLICHMYIFSPRNYVHVAVQEERIDEKGERHVKPMKHLCYHDSCWRDAIQEFIFTHRDNLNGFQSLLKLFDWYDVITLTEDEIEYLRLLVRQRDISNGLDKNKFLEALKNNPFDKRSVWNR